MDKHTSAKWNKQSMQGRLGLYGIETNDDEDISSPHSNGTTAVANNVSTPEQRERASTDDSSASNESVSKRTLVRLMREQVDLVRNLTDAQVAQKAELEKVKAEKRKLEAQQQERERAERRRSRRPAPPPAPYHHHSPSASTKLNLPTHVQPESSDNRSVSSRSFVTRYFSRPFHKPRRHPDADYFANGNRQRGYSSENAYEENTLANGSPSVASTILPSAIVIDAGKAHSTGAFGDIAQPTYAGPGVMGTFGYPNKDRIEITRIPDRNVVPEDEGTGCISRMWWLFSRLCTLLIPDFLLCCVGRHARVKKGMTPEQKKATRTARKEAKQAWREKVAIFLIMVFFSACFIGISGVIPMFLCRETTVFTMVRMFKHMMRLDIK